MFIINNRLCCIVSSTHSDILIRVSKRKRRHHAIDLILCRIHRSDGSVEGQKSFGAGMSIALIAVYGAFKALIDQPGDFILTSEKKTIESDYNATQCSESHRIDCVTFDLKDRFLFSPLYTSVYVFLS